MKNKSAIFGAVQLEERCQQQSKRQMTRNKRRTKKEEDRKRQGTKNNVNKSAIIGIVQLEEQSQEETKAREEKEEHTQTIILCFFVPGERTMNHHLQPAVLRKHHTNYGLFIQAVVNSRTEKLERISIFDMDYSTIQSFLLLLTIFSG